MNQKISRLAFVLCISFVGIMTRGQETTVGGPPTDLLPDRALPGGQTMLPDGWKLSPVGTATKLAGDMPTKMLVTADGKYVLTATGGYNEHGISVVDTATGQLVDHVKVTATFAGLCIDQTGHHVRLSTAGAKGMAVDGFAFDHGTLKPEAGIDLPDIPAKNKYIGGLACGPDGAVYVASIEENKIYKVAAGNVTATDGAGYRPCAIALSPAGDLLAVANWGDQSISLIDTAAMKPLGKVAVGSHPSDVAWASNGRIFAANAGGNTVSVISVKTMAVTETIRTSLDFQVPVGSTPVALAVDPAGKRLYVANAGNDDVAVVDISDADESKVLGFIPTGWYPCAIAVSPDSKTVYIGTGKALDKFTPNGPDKTYIGKLLTGHVSVVKAPDEKILAGYTRQVLANTPVPRPADQLPKNQTTTLAAMSRIKHVIYVIKENRTYDQVFGDMPQGNGDPSLTMFGQKVTPNEHAIARQWVLLDNLYCNGEVSADGHAWCDAAYADDFNQRHWTNTYSGRKGVDADDRLDRSPGGYIWDNAMAHKLSFISYGEGAEFLSSPDQAPDVKEDSMKEGTLSKAWQKKAWNMGRGERDFERLGIFIDDLHAAEKSGDFPALTVMCLPEDHTVGRTAGKHTPDSCVAANDLAVGKLVDAVTHSRFWPETAIFIIEDDAQNGNDHVDAHRTVGLVISPYTRRGAVDHTMYTTASMVRTIELILQLPPMTQFDAAATPMFAAFQPIPNAGPYTAIKQQIDLAAVNPGKGRGVKESAELDWSDLDRADPDKLNAILWDYFKPGTPMPAPVRSMVFVQ